MSLIKKNLAANFISSAWMPLLWVVVVPMYMSTLGEEPFGLVGVYVVIQSVVALLDLGLSMTLNREFARLSLQPDSRPRMRDLLRTLEVVYWATALLIAAGVAAVAHPIASLWVKPVIMSQEAVKSAVWAMAPALALQWPLALYGGGLMGLQKQASLAVINVVMLTARFVGVLPLLWFVSPSMEMFFGYQAMAGLLHTLLAAIWLWRSLPSGCHKAAFRLDLLRSIWHFATGLFVISVLATMLTQVDKVVLSNLLTLKMFGYYTVVALIATALYRLFVPVFSALYPRFTQLVEMKDFPELNLLYHRGCQLMAVLTFSVSAVLVFFPRQALFVWTGNYEVADQMSLVLSLLVVGTALNGLITLPYCMQLASGWTRLALVNNALAVAVLVPGTYLLAKAYGAAGAASAWIILNAGYVLVNIQIMHRRILVGQMGKWYLQDCLLPLIGPLAVGGAALWMQSIDMTRAQWGAALAAVFLLALVISGISAPLVRAATIETICRLRRNKAQPPPEQADLTAKCPPFRPPDSLG